MRRRNIQKETTQDTFFIFLVLFFLFIRIVFMRFLAGLDKTRFITYFIVVSQMKNLLVTATTFPRWKGDSVPDFVLELSKRLTKDFNVTVLAPHSRGARDFEVMEGVKVYRYRYFFERWEKITEGGILPNLHKNPLLYFQLFLLVLFQFFAVLKVIKREKIDKMQAHWITQGLVAAVVKKIKKIPYVFTTHGGELSKKVSPLFNPFKKFVFRNAESVTVVNSFIEREVKKKFGKGLKTNIIPMGVDCSEFSPEKKNLGLKKSLGAKGNLIIFVGRLVRLKGVGYLINAMPEIIQKFPDLKLAIIGGGGEREKLEKIVAEKNLGKRVSFLGAIPKHQLPPYYASADIFVSPSLDEGLPVTFMEAMASGCNVICTGLEGNRDIISDGKTGRMIGQRNSREISRTVIELLSDRKKAEKMRKNALDYARKNYDWKIISGKFADVLLR
jgi:glycosyltransferase involved in cell wall biosynthesis